MLLIVYVVLVCSAFCVLLVHVVLHFYFIGVAVSAPLEPCPSSSATACRHLLFLVNF